MPDPTQAEHGGYRSVPLGNAEIAIRPSQPTPIGKDGSKLTASYGHRIMKSIPVTPAELDQVAMLNSQVTAFSAAASFALGTLVNIAIGWVLAENLSDAARNGLILGCIASGGIGLGLAFAAWKSRSLKMSKWADILNSTEFD